MNDHRLICTPILAAFTLLVSVIGFQSTLLAQSDSETAELESVRSNLEKLIPSRMEIRSISQTPMEGVYEVAAGSETLFVYSAGEHLMIGEVFDIERRISWTQERKDKEKLVALAELNSMPESEMIIMGDAEGERYITVFTDTDCGWCQKFHQSIPALAQGGLKVRYMLWPRSGVNTPSYHEAVSVWCADDQGEAMTSAKNRRAIAEKVCDNPVEEHMQLGFKLGVQGTPFVMLDTGEILGGYVPANELLAKAGLAQ